VWLTSIDGMSVDQNLTVSTGCATPEPRRRYVNPFGKENDVHWLVTTAYERDFLSQATAEESISAGTVA
jgi:hypothetical protein